MLATDDLRMQEIVEYLRTPPRTIARHVERFVGQPVAFPMTARLRGLTPTTRYYF